MNDGLMKDKMTVMKAGLTKDERIVMKAGAVTG